MASLSGDYARVPLAVFETRNAASVPTFCNLARDLVPYKPAFHSAYKMVIADPMVKPQDQIGRFLYLSGTT
jgi:hypothetical protein